MPLNSNVFSRPCYRVAQSFEYEENGFDVHVLVCAIMLLPVLEEMVVQFSEKKGTISLLDIRAVGTFLLWPDGCVE